MAPGAPSRPPARPRGTRRWRQPTLRPYAVRHEGDRPGVAARRSTTGGGGAGMNVARDEEFERVRNRWLDDESPSSRLADWVGTFTVVGRELMSPDERQLLAELPEEFTVYRGFAHPSARGGLSYTLDRDIAAFFASRAAKLGDHDDIGPRILSGRIRRSDVLALFLSRREVEVVLDPDDITVTEELPVSETARREEL